MRSTAITILLRFAGFNVENPTNEDPQQVDDEIKFLDYPSISIQVHPSGSYCCASLSGGEGEDFWVQDIYPEFRPTTAKVNKMAEFLKDYIKKNLPK